MRRNHQAPRVTGAPSVSYFQFCFWVCCCECWKAWPLEMPSDASYTFLLFRMRYVLGWVGKPITILGNHRNLGIQNLFSASWIITNNWVILLPGLQKHTILPLDSPFNRMRNTASILALAGCYFGTVSIWNIFTAMATKLECSFLALPDNAAVYLSPLGIFLTPTVSQLKPLFPPKLFQKPNEVVWEVCIFTGMLSLTAAVSGAILAVPELTSVILFI